MSFGETMSELEFILTMQEMLKEQENDDDSDSE